MSKVIIEHGLELHVRTHRSDKKNRFYVEDTSTKGRAIYINGFAPASDHRSVTVSGLLVVIHHYGAVVYDTATGKQLDRTGNEQDVLITLDKSDTEHHLLITAGSYPDDLVVIKP